MNNPRTYAAVGFVIGVGSLRLRSFFADLFSDIPCLMYRAIADSRSFGLVNSSHKRISTPKSPTIRMIRVRAVTALWVLNRATLSTGWAIRGCFDFMHYAVTGRLLEFEHRIAIQ